MGHYSDIYEVDVKIPPPKQGLGLTEIPANKVIILKLDLPYSCSHPCSFLDGTKALPSEVSPHDLMRGDRRTFMGESSIRVLENKLGIERDKTLTYQNSYRRNNLASGHYNDSAVRGGYNTNTGAPYKRQAEVPTYQLGRQPYDHHKRMKTGEERHEQHRRPNYDPFNPYGGNSRGPPVQAPPPMAYPPRQPTNYYGGPEVYQGYIPNRNPNDQANYRPPPTSQYSSFDPQRYPQGQQRQRPSERGDRKRDNKRNGNRFSDFGS